MLLAALIVHLFTPHHSNNHRAKLLHPHLMAIIAIKFAFLQVALLFLPSLTPQVFAYHAQITPKSILDFTNEKRLESEMQPLEFDEKLNEAAFAKASHMFANNYWAHTAPDGTEPWYFFVQSGYTYRFAGENLARDFSEPEEVVEAWMNSPTHRENLLSPRYEEIGIGVVAGELNGVRTTLVVQLFGTEMSRATAIEERLSEISGQAEVATVASIAGEQSDVGDRSGALPFKIPPFYVLKWAAVFLGLLFTFLVILDMGFVTMKKVERVGSKSIAHLLFFFLIIGVALLVKAGNIL